jgi:hypothetical protein
LDVVVAQRPQNVVRRLGLGRVDRQRAPVGLGCDEDAAGAHDSRHLGGDLHRVRDMLERPFDARGIDARVRERQLVRVGEMELGTHRHAGLLGLVDHGPAVVDADHAVGATRAASARTSSPFPQPTSRSRRPGEGRSRS